MAVAVPSRAAPSETAPGSGALWLGEPDAGVAALLLETTLELDVEGLLAELTLTQRFRNTSDRWLDGTYLFPLPQDAAVRGLELGVGERTVVGEVRERTRARATFEAASAAGQVAALVEQRRPNLFTARVASIAPGAEIRVRLDVLLPVEASEERLSLTLPTTLTPRYANAFALDADALGGPILPAGSIDGPRMTLAARIRPLADLSLATSDTHPLETDGGRLRLSDAPMDRDVVIAWPFAQGTAPRGDAFVARHAGSRYVQLFMAPPEAPALDPDAAPPRELVLVVDVSGSMAGLSIEAAREAALGALDGLGPRDRVDVIAFDDRVRAAFDGPEPVTPATLEAARRFVRGLEAGGGTEMGPALARALSPPGKADVAVAPRRAPFAARLADDDPAGPAAARRADAAAPDERSAGDRNPGGRDAGDRDASERDGAGRHDAAAGPPSRTSPPLRQIVFLTDGSIADEARLLARIERGIGDARLFTVGIGSAPNRWFLDKAAELGRGRALVIRDRHDVHEAISALLGRLERPVLTGIAVRFPGGRAETHPARVPDLYADEPLMVVARLDGEAHEAIVTGWRGDRRFRRRIALPAVVDTPASATGEVAPALAMHWARSRIASLRDAQRRANDPERHRHAITRLALEVGLVSPYTSFVAVERTASRPDGAPRGAAEVANLLPAGNAMHAITMPRGAAGIDTLAWLAVLLATAALGLRRLSGRLAPAVPT